MRPGFYRTGSLVESVEIPHIPDAQRVVVLQMIFQCIQSIEAEKLIERHHLTTF